MAKKKKKFKKHAFRNAAPRAARSPAQSEETPARRLALTAAGAAGTSLVGSFLVHEGWAPKTISTALAAVGAGLAWKGDASNIRSIGAGAMSAAGSQLALMLLDERDQKDKAAKAAAESPNKPANAGQLPPGSLENAFERAKARLAMSSDQDAA